MNDQYFQVGQSPQKKSFFNNGFGGLFKSTKWSDMNTGQKIGAGFGVAEFGMNLANRPTQHITSQTPMQTVDAYGMPQYNNGSLQNEVNAFKPAGASGGEIIGGALQGASVGATFGGVGAAVGAGVGALGTAISGLFGESQEEKEKRNAQGRLLASQNAYNSSMKNYNQNYLSQQNYLDQLKMYNMPTRYV